MCDLAHSHPGYKIKDNLENKLHDLVCDDLSCGATAKNRSAC
jgi:hypothetical protein